MQRVCREQAVGHASYLSVRKVYLAQTEQRRRAASRACGSWTSARLQGTVEQWGSGELANNEEQLASNEEQ